MRPGSWLAVLLLVACGGGQAASTSPSEPTTAETVALVVWLVWEPDVTEVMLDRQYQCQMEDVELTVADEAGTVMHQTDRGLVRGKMAEQVECRARTVLSGVPAAGFYQLAVSGEDAYATVTLDGEVTVESGDEATVDLR